MAVAVIACLGLISCKNDVQVPAAEELVSVSFVNDNSRALTATIDQFEADGFYWFYESVKADSTGLISGETGFGDTIDEIEQNIRPVKKNGSVIETGLDGVVTGFSKGLWKFRLYACLKVSGNYVPVYWGESSNTLIDESNHDVFVTVSPLDADILPDSVGYLSVGDIILTPAIEQDLDDAFTSVDTVKKVTDNGFEDLENVVFENGKYTLQPGRYMFTREIKLTDSGSVVASGSVMATVYANLTTTISGDLDEMLSYVIFDSDSSVKDPQPVSIATKIIPVTVDETGPAPVLVVRAETEIQTGADGSEEYFKVTYPEGAVLKSDTAYDGSDSDKRADAELGFVYVGQTPYSEISIETTQAIADYELTLNVDESNNEVLIEVQKNIGVGLDVVAIYHNGDEIADSPSEYPESPIEYYSYSPSSGILTLYVFHASKIDVVTNVKCSHPQSQLAGTFCLVCQHPVPFVTEVDPDVILSDENLSIEYNSYDFENGFKHNCGVFSSGENIGKTVTECATDSRRFVLYNFASYPDGFKGFSDEPEYVIDIEARKIRKATTEEIKDVSEEDREERFLSERDIFAYFSEWGADYYVFFDKDVKAESLALFGYYERVNYGMYILMKSDIDADIFAEGASYKNGIPLLGSALPGGQLTYGNICEGVDIFTCGCYNFSDDNVGTTMTVVLRITNPNYGIGNDLLSDIKSIDVCTIYYKILRVGMHGTGASIIDDGVEF